MSWENANDLTEEETNAEFAPNNYDAKVTSGDEQLQNEIIKLQKYQDPAKNPERQAYLSLLRQFADYIMTNNIQTMVKTILTDDCKFFLFSSTTGRAPAQYCLRPEDLRNLYKGIQIKEQRVREVYIDIEKTSAVQLCNFKTLYEGQDDPVDEIVAEVFTIKDNKISKYRAFFGETTGAHGQADPFATSIKSKSLAKVMEINYAISDQPDFEKVASLLHDNVEYKIWSWDSRKCFTFTKQDLAEKFQNELEENYVIKSIVPYEVFTEAKFVYGTYVYHLEGKSGEKKNKKFVWLSTCVYSFDKNLNIIKVAQQGELYPEGEVTIPFAVYSRETLLQTVNKITRNIKPSADAFYDDLVDFNCMSYHFGCESMPNIGVFCGLDNMEMVIAESKKGNLRVSHLKAIDLFVDSNGSSYDHVITIPWCIGKFTFPGFKYSGVEMNIISFVIYTLENGKMVKSFSIVAMIPESIPPPFEDLYPEGTNLISRGVET